MKTVAITQPNFMAWIGYFEMIDRVDQFILLDDVQFVRRDWINRNRIAGATADSMTWITVSVKKASRDTLINQIKLFRDTGGTEKHLRTIKHFYTSSPCFDQYYPGFSEILKHPYENLLNLNVAIIKFAMACFGIKTQISLSSDYRVGGRKDDRLSGLCLAAGADVYVANSGSRTYIDSRKFTEKGIGFVFQDFDHPDYPRGSGQSVPFLSFLDLLFWHGEDAVHIIRKGRAPDWEDNICYS